MQHGYEIERGFVQHGYEFERGFVRNGYEMVSLLVPHGYEVERAFVWHGGHCVCNIPLIVWQIKHCFLGNFHPLSPVSPNFGKNMTRSNSFLLLVPRPSYSHCVLALIRK